MGSFLQIPYRESRHGIWGEQTSTLNWCEEVRFRVNLFRERSLPSIRSMLHCALSASWRVPGAVAASGTVQVLAQLPVPCGTAPLSNRDYNITYYCAEFVNSITNLMFIWLGIRGIRDCIRFRHRPVFVVACIGYIVVGLGSIAFHTTLKCGCKISLPPSRLHCLFDCFFVTSYAHPPDSMQLADELPMIYATCIIGHATFSYGKSPTVSKLIGLGLFSLGLLITVVYHVTKEPVFHQVSFACLTIAVVFRSMYDMEKTLRPALKIRSPERESGLMRQMWKMCLSGIALFLVGFFIWNMDNIFCLYLRSWRDILLLPWAVVLEGHAWWHILTGLAYYFIMWRLWLHTCLDGKEDEFALQWKTALTSIPRVVPVSDIEPSDAAYKGRRLD
ncbi:dihydroceramidase [Sporothrix schenckii 1099-18]|uniref:Dihydroceramidase n=1 Tax=Sporothrix schenckii 1099-18 TaxID=1397361 RepID=A0A0F2M6S2_SPOSC|nr:dihydroceramidase [Sporothrix schenckii 1099-18]KJR85332.1 dihydroceramidase [Sporothrix schenckii 1099-18]